MWLLYMRDETMREYARSCLWACSVGASIC
uniref:Uncharacterized protein n=1 Tax=Arundo donax TaxID=35708 RepID=A0A0A9CPI6_ARUDO